MKRQTREDRLHESEGMKRYWEAHDESDYGRVAGESSMIHEDHRAPANLPQEKMLKYYPECEYIDQGYYNDGRDGIDRRLDDEVRKIDRSMRKQGPR